MPLTDDKNKISEDEIDAGFVANFLQPSIPATYALRLCLTAILVLLPAILYLLVAGTIIYYILYYAISMFPLIDGNMGTLHLMLYLVFLILGVPIVLFLLRPFFRCKPKVASIELLIEDQPRLYYFANSISRKLAANKVEHIRLTNEVIVEAAYCSCRDVLGNRLTLTIGIPLISAVNTDQLAALIAHELSHFRQSKLSRCYFLIRFIRSWFYRVINNEDAWEKRAYEFSSQYVCSLGNIVVVPIRFFSTLINKLTKRGSGKAHAKLEGLSTTDKKCDVSIVKIIMPPVRLGVGVVHGIFSLANNFVEQISRKVASEAEYIADHYQGNIIGSENFSPLIKRLARVDQAYHCAMEKILSNERKPNDFRKFVHQCYQKNSIKSDQYIEMAGSEYFTSWSLHPSPLSRVRRMEEKELPSMYFLGRPSDDLFCGLDALSIKITKELFRVNDLDIASERLGKSQNEAHEGGPNVQISDSLDCFSNHLFSSDIVWDVPDIKNFLESPIEKLTPFLNKLIVSIRHNIPEFEDYYEAIDEHNNKNARLHFYKRLVKDGSRERPSGESIEKLEAEIEEFNNKHKDRLESYKKFYGTRVASAIALGKNVKAFPQACKLIFMLKELNLLQKGVAEMKIKSSTLEQLLERRRSKEGSLHQKSISQFSRRMLKLIDELEQTMSAFPLSLLGAEHAETVLQNRLDLEHMNGEDYEQKIIDRFKELVGYFEGFNTAISNKLAKFCEINEKNYAIESVATVKL